MDSKYKPGSVTSLVGWVIWRTSSSLKKLLQLPPNVLCWWAQPKLEWLEKRRPSKDWLRFTIFTKVFMTDLLGKTWQIYWEHQTDHVWGWGSEMDHRSSRRNTEIWTIRFPTTRRTRLCALVLRHTDSKSHFNHHPQVTRIASTKPSKIYFFTISSLHIPRYANWMPELQQDFRFHVLTQLQLQWSK